MGVGHSRPRKSCRVSARRKELSCGSKTQYLRAPPCQTWHPRPSSARLIFLATVMAAIALGTAACSTPGMSTVAGLNIPNGIPAGAQGVLAKPESMQLYALDPSSPSMIEGNPAYAGSEKLHGYRVLGQTPVAAESQLTVLQQLYDGIDANEGEAAMWCFNPRHGLRISSQGVTVELVICFDCLQIRVHDAGGRETVLTQRNAEPLFDQVLADARIPVARKQLRK